MSGPIHIFLTYKRKRRPKSSAFYPLYKESTDEAAYKYFNISTYVRISSFRNFNVPWWDNSLPDSKTGESGYRR